MLIYIILYTLILMCLSVLLNDISYNYLKNRIIKKQKWDLNICCGHTDVATVNADIFKHGNIKNFVLLDNIYQLPFEEQQFNEILCSHTIEHVDDPAKFHEELTRVGKNVTYLVPPIWDITAAFNFFEHKWIFLTFSKKHKQLPKYIKLPFSQTFHQLFGQKIKA